MKNVITSLLLALLVVAVILLSEDLKEQEALLDELVDKHNEHLKYTEGQMDVLINHQKDIEGIVAYLLEVEARRSFVSYR